MKKIIAFILLLIIIDQGSKLLILNSVVDQPLIPRSNNAGNPDNDKKIDILPGFLEIHPVLHDKGLDAENERKYNPHNPSSAIFWIAHIGLTLLSVLLYKIFHFFSEKWRYIKTMFLYLWVASVICAVIDKLFWGGSLDFICFYEYGSDSSFVLYHIIFDLKDFYISIGAAISIICLIIFLFDLIRFMIKHSKMSRDEKEQFDSEMKTNIKNWIKSGCPARPVL